ncbi:MAG: hypothetical protein IKG61_01365 [Selenomonadaceae bacterium]|nr:hypothetical protein [Selenomonadaceae bacterium]
MKHNLKFPDGTIKAVDCKLGSGIVDKNGKEIFAGDLVKAENDDVGFYKSDVWFEAGRFRFGMFVLTDFKPNELEVVGHVFD